MDIMRGLNIPVPKGGMATSVSEASKVYKDIIGDGNDCVIKAMVLCGKLFILIYHIYIIYMAIYVYLNSLIYIDDKSAFKEPKKNTFKIRT